MYNLRPFILAIFGFSVTLLAALTAFHLPASPAAAQGAPTTSDNKVWLSYFHAEEITSLAVTGDDVWAGTEAGLTRWNRLSGQVVQQSTSNGLPGNWVAKLTLDPSGKPWAYTKYDGISRLDGQSWIALPDLAAVDLAFDQRSPAAGAAVWIINPNGVSSYKGQPLPELQASYTVTTGLTLQNLTRLAFDPAGRPWVAGPGGAGYFDGQRWITYTVEDGLPGQPVTTLRFDPAGRPWLGSRGGGVSHLNPAGSPGKAWTTYTVEDGLTSNWISAIAFDAAGQAWVGTTDRGVSHLALDEQAGDDPSWTRYTVADGLAGHVVEAIVIDAAGQPWVVTRNDGVSHFDGRRWTTYPYPGDSGERWVTATTPDNAGQLWIGQANGQVSQLNWGEQAGEAPRWTTYHSTGPADNYITAAAVDGAGRRWFGTTRKGVISFDGQNWIHYTMEDGLVDNRVLALAIDESGQPWVGTERGVSHFDGQRWASFTTADGLAHNRVTAMAMDGLGNKWFGTSGGLSRFDGQSWTSYTIEDGLVHNDIQAIAVDEAGQLWLGTYAGVSHFVWDGGAGGPSWMTYTTEDGLVDNNVYAVAVDELGNKWFGTLSGLSQFDGRSWFTHTTATGLADKWAQSLAFDQAGDLWVGSENGGVSEFDGRQWLVHSANLKVSAIAVDPAGPLWFGTTNSGVRALVDAAQAPDLSFTLEPVSSTPPASVTGTTIPAAPAPPANLAAVAPPLQPLQAWSVAPDGAVFVLDAVQSLYQLAPADLTPLAQVPPLFERGDSAYLVAGPNQVFVGNTAFSQTLVLERATFTEVARLNQAGPMALDPERWLVMIPAETDAPIYSWEFWAYDLADLSRPPRRVQTACSSGPPVTDPAHRRLYIRVANCGSSPPHARNFYEVYDLDSLSLLAYTEGREPGTMDRPALAGQADFIVTVYHAAFGQSQLVLFDLQGQELRSGPWKRYGSLPVTDPQGEWFYLLRSRGLTAWRGADLSLQGLLPLTTTAPADIALSPSAERLYLFGNGWLTALATSELQGLGLQPVSPFPTTWMQEKDYAGELWPVWVYPSPTFAQDGVAFVELIAPYERYRTTDAGRSWTVVLSPDQPLARWPGLSETFSLSPNFSQDRTVVTLGLRSTDGGETWHAWSPVIAFTTDRTGNREIYSMNQAGQELQQLTDNPAADENPAWSPAWTQLAFQSDRFGQWDIFSIRADCQSECELQRLTDDPADDMLPAWSPDGRSIAFVSTRDGNPEIYVMDHEGNNQRRLTFDEAGDWRPAWLRDSQHLVFTSGRSGNNDIYQLTVPPVDSPALTAEVELIPVISSPSDDRDPALGPGGDIFFLADREGIMKTYRGPATIDAYSNQNWSEGHPSPLGWERMLVSVEENGATKIYQIGRYSEPVLLTGSAGGFNGQPAAGPVWWQPDPVASRAWLATNRGD